MTELELTAFMEIVKCGSISGAAEKLYISQPALTRRIQTLELELGYKLLDRKKGIRAATLTYEGELFLPVAERWIDVWEEARSISSANRRHVFNIATITSIGTSVLPAVIRSFLENTPNIVFSLKTYHSDESYKYIADGQLDFALVTREMFSRNIETHPVFEEAFYLASSKPLNDLDSVRPQYLDINREIWAPWGNTFQTWHEYWFGTERPAISIDQMSLLEEFLHVYDGWSIVPASIAHTLRRSNSVYLYPLEDGPENRTVYCIHVRRKQRLAESFLHHLTNALTPISGVILK